MKRYDKLKELIENELGDYSYFEGWEIELEYQEKEYDVFTLNNRCNDARFRVWDDKIEVELGEDSYYKVEYYEYTIKYFWQAILSWD